MENLIDEIKKNNLDLGVEEIKGLLYLLKSEKDLTNNGLVTLTGLPKETLKRFKKSVSNLLEDEDGDGLSLNEKGRVILSSLNLSPYRWSLVEMFDYSQDKNYLKNIEEIKHIKETFSPRPKREFDQFLATPQTSFLKAKILIEKGLVDGMSTAFIGDDDLNSLCLASMKPNFKSITVFDIDEEIIKSINKFSSEKGLNNLHTVLYDVRKNLDSKYLGKFDIVVFDPPYTKSGVTVFLQRSVELIGHVRDFERKYVFMYYGNSFKSPEKILKVQEIINRFGLSIEDRIEKFARYSGAESIGNASALYILKTNKFTKVLGSVDKNIYTFEDTKEEKFPFVDHLVFKVFGVKKDMLISKSRVLSVLEKISKSHRLKIVDKKVTDFKGGGMTISLILANSNFTVHTWPEFGSVHIDLITCSPIYNKESLQKTVSDAFGTEKVEAFFIE